MKIALVTRAKTRNQGNVALSLVWRNLLAEAFPSSQIVVMERIPSYLKRYALADFERARDPIKRFEMVAEKIAARTRRSAKPNLASDPIVLDLGAPSKPGLTRLKKWANLRNRLANLGLFNRSFADRQSTVAACDLMVMNAAGEFLPGLTDTPLQYMLDLRVAQKLGLRTAFVNTSFEIQNPLVRRIALHTLDHADLILFRDEPSGDNYRAAGGKRETLTLPDAAMLFGEMCKPAAPNGRVAIAISAALCANESEILKWRSLARSVQEAGFTPVFISNEWSTDVPHFGPWLEEDGFEALGANLQLEQFIEMVSGFDVMVSSRLHSCVLGIVAGTPVIPVEMGTFKIKGYFSQIGISVCPVAQGTDWVPPLLKQVQNVAGNKIAKVTSQQALLVAARSDFRARFSSLIKALG